MIFPVSPRVQTAKPFENDVSVEFEGRGIVDEVCIFDAERGVRHLLIATPTVKNPTGKVVSRHTEGLPDGRCKHVISVSDGENEHRIGIIVSIHKKVFLEDVSYAVEAFIFRKPDGDYADSVYPPEA